MHAPTHPATMRASTERCRSGRTGLTRNQVYASCVPRVRIPVSPPHMKEPALAGFFICGRWDRWARMLAVRQIGRTADLERSASCDPAGARARMARSQSLSLRQIQKNPRQRVFLYLVQRPVGTRAAGSTNRQDSRFGAQHVLRPRRGKGQDGPQSIPVSPPFSLVDASLV